jgi:hypothetical protein
LKPHHKLLALPLLLALLLLTTTSTSRATTIQNEDPQFTLNVPNQYIHLNENAKFHYNDKNLYGFASTNASYGLPDTLILIQRLPGPMGRDPLNLSDPAFQSVSTQYGITDIHLTKAHWSNFAIDLIEGKAAHDGMEFATAVAQVPLAGHAIQIIVLVRLDLGEAEAANTVRDFLDGLTGESNWTTDAATASTNTDSPQLFNQNFLKLISIAALIAGAMVALALSRRGSSTSEPVPADQTIPPTM